MIREIILGATLSLFAMGASAAGITLSGKGVSHRINVFCKDGTNPGSAYKEGPMPIPANGSLPELPWALISSSLMFDSNNLICKFVLNNTNPQIVVGRSVLLIKSDESQGEVQNVSMNPLYTVNISPSINTYAPSISVALQTK
jgi:hypothetical protein